MKEVNSFKHGTKVSNLDQEQHLMPVLWPSDTQSEKNYLEIQKNSTQNRHCGGAGLEYLDWS
ncbi:hypothetical protein QOZ95_001521 [Paenibacillus brasilensis]|uniref:Uncharacterized protein n=1 Tax=Paenibacillus brasilensis TaxID=128574 RepID=A0ABU0KVB8_9BACL|nr:hypothetical protein [Paenibacillus brasilensis]